MLYLTSRKTLDWLLRASSHIFAAQHIRTDDDGDLSILDHFA
jgi:hypothetical protein